MLRPVDDVERQGRAVDVRRRQRRGEPACPRRVVARRIGDTGASSTAVTVDRHGDRLGERDAVADAVLEPVRPEVVGARACTSRGRRRGRRARRAPRRCQLDRERLPGRELSLLRGSNVDRRVLGGRDAVGLRDRRDCPTRTARRRLRRGCRARPSRGGRSRASSPGRPGARRGRCGRASSRRPPV